MYLSLNLFKLFFAFKPPFPAIGDHFPYQENISSASFLLSHNPHPDRDPDPLIWGDSSYTKSRVILIDWPVNEIQHVKNDQSQLRYTVIYGVYHCTGNHILIILLFMI